MKLEGGWGKGGLRGIVDSPYEAILNALQGLTTILTFNEHAKLDVHVRLRAFDYLSACRRLDAHVSSALIRSNEAENEVPYSMYVAPRSDLICK